MTMRNVFIIVLSAWLVTNAELGSADMSTKKIKMDPLDLLCSVRVSGVANAVDLDRREVAATLTSLSNSPEGNIQIQKFSDFEFRVLSSETNGTYEHRIPVNFGVEIRDIKNHLSMWAESGFVGSSSGWIQSAYARLAFQPKDHGLTLKNDSPEGMFFFYCRSKKTYDLQKQLPSK